MMFCLSLLLFKRFESSIRLEQQRQTAMEEVS